MPLSIPLAAAALCAFGAAGAAALAKRGSLAVACFNAVLVACTLPPYLLAKLGVVVARCRPFHGASLRRRAVLVATCLCWRLVFRLCCWIRLRVEGLEEFRASLGASGLPAVIVANHTSFLDTILLVSFMPVSNVSKVKMFMSAHLLKIPFLRTIVQAMGHISVPFRQTGDHDCFDIDKDVMAERMQELEAHVKAGGTAGWFPEGRMNPGDAGEVGVFRAGGFSLAVHVDVEVWCVAFAGNGECWPRAAAAGGRPARIGVRIFRLCRSSKEFIAAGAAGAQDEQAACRLLANSAKDRVQAAVHELLSQGFARRQAAEEQRPLLNRAG